MQGPCGKPGAPPRGAASPGRRARDPGKPRLAGTDARFVATYP